MYTPIFNGSRHYGNNRWWMYSRKLCRAVHLQSNLEYQHCLLVEMDPEVVMYCEQPLRIQVQMDGRTVASIFDMWIKYRDTREEFVEIKYSSHIDLKNPRHDPRALIQITAQKIWCEQNGFMHSVRTEKTIRDNPILIENLRAMVPYLRQRSNPIDLDVHKLLTVIGDGSLTLKDLYRRLPELSPARIHEGIAWLIYSGTINGNYTCEKFGQHMVVWKNGCKKIV